MDYELKYLKYKKKYLELKDQVGGFYKGEIVSVKGITRPGFKYLNGRTVRIVSPRPLSNGRIIINEVLDKKQQSIETHLRPDTLFSYSQIFNIVNELDKSLKYKIISNDSNNGKIIYLLDKYSIIDRDNHTINVLTLDHKPVEVHPFNLVIENEAKPTPVRTPAVRRYRVDPKQNIKIIGAGPVGLFAAYILGFHGYTIDIYEKRTFDDNFTREQVFIIRQNVLDLIKNNFPVLYQKLIESSCLQIFNPPRTEQVTCFKPTDSNLRNIRMINESNPEQKAAGISIQINKLQEILYDLISNSGQHTHVKYHFSTKIQNSMLDEWISQKTFMILIASGRIRKDTVGNYFNVETASWNDIDNLRSGIFKGAVIRVDKKMDDTTYYSTYTTSTGRRTDDDTSRAFPTKHGQRYIGAVYDPTQYREFYESDQQYDNRYENFSNEILSNDSQKSGETEEQFEKRLTERNLRKKRILDGILQRIFEHNFREYSEQNKDITWDEFRKNSRFIAFPIELYYVKKPYIKIDDTHMFVAGDSNFTPHFFSGLGVNVGFNSVIRIARSIPCGPSEIIKNCYINGNKFFDTYNIEDYNEDSHWRRRNIWFHYGYEFIFRTGNRQELYKYKDFKLNPGDGKYYTEDLFKKTFPTSRMWDRLKPVEFKVTRYPRMILTREEFKGRDEEWEDLKPFTLNTQVDYRYDFDNKNRPINTSTFEKRTGSDLISLPSVADVKNSPNTKWNSLERIPMERIPAE
uniref:Uncharacterized protein n=1 Tax=Megaviridae environmental sample TaxID=1737588 RepID=A0A5J6VKC3_9VIRU|nr:MAG: hypothetical protein [Megaviridae environmental sample]